jgi:two-component system, LuxR family, response regulator FixJ
MDFQEHSRDLLGSDDMETPTVFVIDPDPATGEILSGILSGYPFEVRTHLSGREFFATYDGRGLGCLVAETRVADASGLQIQRRLAERNHLLPVIYVSSRIDVSTAVLLMRGGALHVLEKPLRSIELFGAIHEAIELDRKRRQHEAEQRLLRLNIAELTQKERKLVKIMAKATCNKEIAKELAISARAVEMRRRGVMEKLGYESPMELIRFALLARDEIDGLLDADEAD